MGFLVQTTSIALREVNQLLVCYCYSCVFGKEKTNKNNNNRTETQKMGRRIVLSFKKGNAKPLQLSVPISSSPLNQS